MAASGNPPQPITATAGDGGESELDYEMEDEDTRGVQRETEAIVLRVFKNQLAGQIEAIIEKQTSKALDKMVALSATQVSGSAGVSSANASKASGSGCVAGAGRERGELRTGGDMVDPFDPDDLDSNVDRWLTMIDQLGEIHGWSEYERSYFMQVKLKGAARSWFNRLEEYGLSWSQWKASLRKAFPRHHDFAVSLEELVARRKLPNESMTHYYHAKLALCGRCRIVGEDAVSCIIRGLPEELRANAYACKCENPEALYAEFLAGLERYKTPLATSGRRVEAGPSSERPRRSSPPPQRQQGGVTTFRCYNCQEYGTHLSRNCPKPRRERCMNCGREDHIHTNCPAARGHKRKDAPVTAPDNLRNRLGKRR